MRHLHDHGEQRVKCHDIAGRRRYTVVTSTSDRTVVQVPPGEIARFEVEDARALLSVLRHAVTAAVPIAPRRVQDHLFVPCQDAVGRARSMGVAPYGERGSLQIVAPGGGTAVFAPLQVGALRAIVRATIAADQASYQPDEDDHDRAVAA
jgi:hypothetical protein